MNELMIDIQKRIDELGSQSAYAEFLGVSDAMVSSVVNGKKKPSKAMLDESKNLDLHVHQKINPDNWLWQAYGVKRALRG
jgi:predicted XRE-type DNA-binding protein